MNFIIGIHYAGDNNCMWCENWVHSDFKGLGTHILVHTVKASKLIEKHFVLRNIFSDQEKY